MSNHLQGMACPNCGSKGPFWISAKCLACVHEDRINLKFLGSHGVPRRDEKIAETTDVSWHDEALCECPSCRFRGIVGDLKETLKDRRYCARCSDLVYINGRKIKAHRFLPLESDKPTTFTVDPTSPSEIVCQNCLDRVALENRDPKKHFVLVKTVVNFRFDYIRAETQELAVQRVLKHAYDLFFQWSKNLPLDGNDIVDSVPTGEGETLNLKHTEWGEEHVSALVDQEFGEADDYVGSNWLFYDAETGKWRKREKKKGDNYEVATGSYGREDP